LGKVSGELLSSILSDRPHTYDSAAYRHAGGAATMHLFPQ
jgi:hypothetical protein